METVEQSLAAGSLFEGRYKLERLLGSGATADVFLAHDLELDGACVAIKIARAISADPRWISRYREEVNICRSLEHPNIVRSFGFGVTSHGTPYQLMEAVDGISLKELLQQGSIGAELRDEICRSVLRALAHAHSRGVAHRDLKPANIFVGADGVVKLGDFGVARQSESECDLTRTGELIGTIAYMSPERLRGELGTSEGDIYSFGLLCYELVTETPLPPSFYLDGTRPQLLKQLSARKNAGIPWLEIVERCTEFEKSRRPTAVQLLSLLSDESSTFDGARWGRPLRKVTRLVLGMLVLVGLFVRGMENPGVQSKFIATLTQLNPELGFAAFHALNRFSRTSGRAPSKDDMLWSFVTGFHLRAATALLGHGASAEPPPQAGMSALCYAIRAGQGEMATLLLNHGASPAQRCPTGTAFNDAVEMELIDVALRILPYESEVNGYAIAQIVKLGNLRLLNAAVRRWQLTLGTILPNNDTLLHLVLVEDAPELLAHLLKLEGPSALRGRDVPIIFSAAQLDRPNFVRMLIEQFHVDPLASDRGLPNAVSAAIASNSVRTVEELAKMGVSLNRADLAYGLPIVLAARLSKLEIGRVLLKAGASFNVPDGNSTPLISCVLGDTQDALANALILEADPSFGDVNGLTPLYWSVIYARWFHFPYLASRTGMVIDPERFVAAQYRVAKHS